MTGKIVPEKDVIRRAALDTNGNEKQHVYVTDDPDLDTNEFFSVTTALDHWENLEKKAAIEGWKDKNDGTDGTEHHDDILRYAQLRGTLCHAEAQEKYADEEVWGAEEELAEEELQNFGEYKGEDAYEKYQKEVDWFVDEIHSLLDGEIAEVICVEAFCFHDNPAYAGQVDLVYRNEDGELVVCDLKTSKQVTYSYFLQANAYARVISDHFDEEVTKLQVARANPNNESSELHTVDRQSTYIEASNSIEASNIIKGEYGYRVVLDTPYNAKEDIKNHWDLAHQKWNSEIGHWTITVRNKDGTVTPDIMLTKLAEKGWTVSVPEGIKQRLIYQVGVDSAELNFEKIKNSKQLSAQFDQLVEEENKNKPLRFAEDIIQQHSEQFDESVLEGVYEYIEEYKGELGDKHPYEICAAVLNLHPVDTTTINEIFEPDNLQENTNLYAKQNPKRIKIY